MPIMSAQESRSDTSRIETAGLACLVAGLTGAVTAVFLAVRPPLVGEDMWTYPQRAGGEFATTQTIFALVHVGMLLGLLGLRWCGAVPATRPGRAGHALAVAGMAGLTVNELLAITAAGSATDSAAAGTIGGVYGLVTTMIGVGMIVAGLAGVRDGAWSGWQRWLPLVTGVWLFVPTMPALFLGGDVARIVLGIWALLFALLGQRLRRADPTVPARPARSRHPAAHVL